MNCWIVTTIVICVWNGQKIPLIIVLISVIKNFLALIDSPLNKAGHLQVYIKTVKNVLIEIHPSIRIPRTFKRFSGLMVQLLHKMKIKAGNNGSTTLMKVVKNPFSQYLPPGTRVFGMTCEGTLYSPQALARALVLEDPLVSDSTDLDKNASSTFPTLFKRNYPIRFQCER